MKEDKESKKTASKKAPAEKKAPAAKAEKKAPAAKKGAKKVVKKEETGSVSNHALSERTYKALKDVYTRETVKEVTVAFVKALRDTLLEEGTEKIYLHKVGVFKRAVTGERQARNPRTGETVTVPPKVKIRFKPSFHLLQDAEIGDEE